VFLEGALKLAIEWMPSSLVRATLGEFVPIFMLHRLVKDNGDICDEKIQRICTYLEYLRRNDYHLLSLDDLVDSLGNGKHIPYKTAIFTIDDGFEEQTEVAGEIFSRFDCPVTLFVISDFINGKLWPWDDQIKYVLLNTTVTRFDVTLPNGNLFVVNTATSSRKRQSHQLQKMLKRCNQTEIYTWLKHLYNVAGMEYVKTPPYGYRPTSWSNLQSFIKAGHKVGPHTKTHRILSQLSDGDAREEIAVSIQELDKNLTGVSGCFAYPTGRKGDFLLRDQLIAEELGCRCAVSTEAKTVTRKSTMMALPRYSLPENEKDFLQYLSFIELAKNTFRHA